MIEAQTLLVFVSVFAAGFMTARAIARKRVRKALKRVERNIDATCKEGNLINENEIWATLNADQIKFLTIQKYESAKKSLINLLNII